MTRLLAPMPAPAAVSSQPDVSNSEFRPWDSRPVEFGDDEDWLR
jgi:hypothetical protein